MKTPHPNFTNESKSKFLQALVLLALVSVGTLSQPVLAQTAPLAPCNLTDIDQDNDGLIEICDLEGLNAMRHQLDGSGYKASDSATKITAGCAIGGCKGYELAKDLDFSAAASYRNIANKATWTRGAGWQPIGYYESSSSTNNKPFKAIFEGNNHTISKLMINRPNTNGVGLFSYIARETKIVNVGLLNVDISGDWFVGGLVGYNEGNIINSYATGSVGEKSYSWGHSDSVGGLVGYNDEGTITNSYATGSVGERSYSWGHSDGVGGLVGYNDEGTITNSYATGSVGERSYSWGHSDGVGGLVGYNDEGTITNSYATGSVGERSYSWGHSYNVGGLVGDNWDGHIANSNATGSVGENSYSWGYSYNVGGLVGDNDEGTITNSYATGAVTGRSSVGGLVGDNWDGHIANSNATGSVEGFTDVGGLVGDGGVIKNSYATGAVTGRSYVGGLVGDGGVIKNSYATGAVTGRSYVGGLVGRTRWSNSITNSYWDTEVSGISSGYYRYGVGLTTEALQSPTTATGVYNRWSTRDWDFGTRAQYPALKYHDGTLMPNQREEPSQIPQIEIAGVPADAVDEGERITLTAYTSSSTSSIPLSYSWTQTSGKVLLIGTTSGSSVTLDVPEDYVAAGSSAGNLVLMLETSSDVGSATQQVLITISKRNNGRIAALGVPSLNERELTASSIDLSGDSDGAGGNVGYQWQSRATAQITWVNVPTVAGTKETYTIPEETRDGTQYRVVVSYTDGQGYREEAMSEAVVYERRVVPQPGIDIANLTSCSTADIDQDNDGLIEICDLEGLNAIRYQLDGSGYKVSTSATKITAGCPIDGCKGYELAKDLDFNDDDSYSSTANKIIWTTGEGWQPIGVYGNSFRGIFEGNDNTISNLMIDRPIYDYIGLFGKNNGAEIDNINLSEVNIRGGYYVGGLVGENFEGTIRNSYVNKVDIRGVRYVGGLVGKHYSGEIDNVDLNRIVIKGYRYVGGLVGENRRGIISNSRVSGDSNAIPNQVEGEGGISGGLVGANDGGKIINSYAVAAVKSEGFQGSRGNEVGGLVGNNKGLIKDSYANGSAASANSFVGGLVGANDGGKITNSYATGSVEGRSHIGGLVGARYSGSKITNSYATGSVEGDAWVGGLVGWSWNSEISNSYWDKTTSGKATSAGGVGKTTVQLQSSITATGIYARWSTANWDFGTRAQYPALKYRDGTLMPNQRREQPEGPPQIEIAGVPTNAVGEGQRITLTAYVSSSSASSIPLIYQWEQTSGEALLIEHTTLNSVTFNVPEDYVAARSDTGNLVLMLGVSSDVESTTQQVSIPISKRNNGQIAALGAPSPNERELTAPPIDLSGDPDGVGGNIVYQWQSRANAQTAWVNVSTTSEVYIIPKETRGIVQYRVAVRYTDGQGYREEVMSAAVIITSLTSCGTADIDQDNDGLIEICNLEGLNAIRYQPDGTGYELSGPAIKITAGCAEGGCKGYELAKDLDFDDDDSYSSTPNKVIWTTDEGWQPIGTSDNPFNAIFRANKHSISNLMIARSSLSVVGLFGKIGNEARLEGVGLIDVDVRGGWGVGGLVGYNNGGTITNSYVIGLVRGGNSIGGLVGDNYGSITNSHTYVDMSGSSIVGGIVGCNFAGGIVTNSYTVPRINKSSSRSGSGGLLGYNSSSREIVASYWDTEVSGMSSGYYGVGLTTEALQSPTTATGVYSRWSTNDWDFGTRAQYPALKYRDGTLLPNQRENLPLPQIEIAGVPTGAVDEGERITLTAYDSSSASSIPLSYQWEQTSGEALLISPTSGSSVTLDVPEDYVAARSGTSNLVLMLGVSSDVGSTTHQVSITISKRNNGRIAALGVPSLNERELAAPSIDLSGDPDGVGGNIVYQWQSRQSTPTAWINVPTTSTGRVHTISDDTRGIVQYRVVVSYTDGQGYREQIESEALSYRGNTSPNIELPHNNSYIRLIAGQTTAVSVVISEIDTSDIVTLTIEPTSTTGVVNVEPNRISLEASLSETRITQFQLTAVQEGSVRLLLTAIDDSRTTTARADDVELIVEIEAPPLSSCGFVDIDRDNDGLIEICNLEGLNAIRYQLDGTGYRASTSATKITTGCAEGGCKGYELDKDLDFNDDDSYSSTANKIIWTTGEGWQPIGVYGNSFRGIFEGNDNTISNLMIDRPIYDYIGLFGRNFAAEIDNINLSEVDIRGQDYVGGLVGVNDEGTIRNSNVNKIDIRGQDYVGGLVGVNIFAEEIDNINLSEVDIRGQDYVGGLVGENFEGTIRNSNVNKIDIRGQDYVGGLVGENDEGIIKDSYANGSVVGNENVGGLAGLNGDWYSKITNSYATGSVEGNDEVGGLIGDNNGNITNSYATGSVEGNDEVGGLIGDNNGNITNSYATGSVEGNDEVGGLVGYNRGKITNSYATGSVEGNDEVGGLVGYNRGKITNSYATGSVEGRSHIGGLVGARSSGSNITNSYATGSVEGDNEVGGLVGWSWNSEISNSYWDKTTSGRATSAGGAGKTTVALQFPTVPGSISTEIYYGWSEAAWDFGTRAQYPALKYRDGTLMPNQRREQPEGPPQIEIAGVPTNAVGEGQRITLTAYVSSSSASNIPLIYQWEQTSGEALLIEHTTLNSVTFNVPEDYVAARSDTVNLVLMLGVSSDVESTTQQVSIPISKRNNGQIAAIGVPSLNERELTAPSIDLSGDPDGVGGNIVYQWQSRANAQTAWVNVSTTSEVYIIPKETRGIIQYRVVVSYTDGQGYREEVMSAAVIITSLTSCGTADIDQDNDGLIEICDLEGLNAIRYQLDGSGYRASDSATKITVGCAEGGCKGYELDKDLDFKDDDSYSSTANKVIWTTGEGWQPIGTFSNSFNAIFRANEYSISNLMIARPSSNKVGLFRRIESQARIEGVGLIDVDIRGNWGASGLVGVNGGGTIINSYVIGLIRGDDSVGGLVGDNYGPITNSYTNVNISGDDFVGGIVGCNLSGGIVTNSYTVPRINRSFSSSGGLLGYNSSSREIVASYWDTEVSGMSSGYYGVGLTTEELQSPTTATGVYNRWSTRDWDFGTRAQYPALKYRDGTLLPNQRRERPEEQPQLPQIEIAGVPTSAVGEGERITLTASNSSSVNSIPLSYSWTQTSGKALLISPTSASSVTLDVSEDYVAAGSGTGNLVLMLGVSSDVGSTTHQVSITISKRNNGRIAAIGVPSLNERELVAPSIDLSGDPDGVSSNIRYQWQSRQSTQTAWINVPTTSTGRVHTIPANARGIIQYRVVVSYTDGQGYREQVESEALSYRGNTSPNIELPHNNSYIRLIAGQTTAVSVVISEIDTSDIVTLTIEPTSTTGVVNVEPNRISLGASLSETRITQFQLTAVQEGSVRLLLTAIDDSRTTTARTDDVELIVEIEAPPLSSCGFVDIDRDNDGLIEICNLEGLNAMRYQLDGTGYRASESALKSTIGCAEGGCKGYELDADLDFDDDDSYSSTTNKVTWTTETGWQPIGYYESYYSNNNKPFKAILEGNNHTISKLMINRPNTDGVGLFGYVTSSTKIVNVGLLNVDIKMGRNYVGGIVGDNRGKITNSYVMGSVKGNGSYVGGLAGYNERSTITNSYAMGSVQGGGLHVGGPSW